MSEAHLFLAICMISFIFSEDVRVGERRVLQSVRADISYQDAFLSASPTPQSTGAQP